MVIGICKLAVPETEWADGWNHSVEGTKCCMFGYCGIRKYGPEVIDAYKVARDCYLLANISPLDPDFMK